jgi:hypothetical protein
LEIREEVGSDPHLNFCMDKIELTEKQIKYISLYVADDFIDKCYCQGGEVGCFAFDLLGTIQTAIEAYNGGAR